MNIRGHIRQNAIYLLLLVLVLATVGAAGAAAQDDFTRSGQERVAVFVSFREVPGPAETALVRSMGGKVKYSYHLVPAIAATVPQAALSALEAHPGVIRVEPDIPVHVVDTELDNTWGVKRIGAGVAHSAGNTGLGVKVAVLDTGIDTDHSDLSYDSGCSENFTADASIEDGHSHGTHTAGTVAALDNGVGVVGVAPDAGLCILKVLSDSGGGDYSDIVAALQFIADYNSIASVPILVTNNSYGSDGDPGTTVKDAFDVLYAQGVLHVAAAGNSGNPAGRGENCIYPALWENVVATAATTQSDSRASFSSTCPELELAAPGYQINSTVPGGGYGEKSGTSMASPHAAGTAALVFAAGITDANGDGLLNDDVRLRLQQTADDLGAAGRDSQYGYGLVDADEAAAIPAPTTDIAITAVDAPSTVFAGDLVNVDVTVENQGSEAVTNDILVTLDRLYDGSVVQSWNQTVSGGLDAGAQTTLNFDWDTTGAPSGDHTLEARHDVDDDDTTDNVASTVVTVEEPTHDVAVTAVDAPATVAAGTLVEVNVHVENQGSYQETFTVSLTDTTDNIEIGSTELTLDAGASATLPFNWDTTGLTGDHTLEAEASAVDGETDTADNMQTTVVTVQSQVTIRVPVATGKDDANSGCSFAASGNEIYVGLDESCSELYTAGFRFADVQIPAGATILNAWLEFTVDGPYNNDVSVLVQGEASGNAGSFSEDHQPSSITNLTAASVQWDITGNWKSGSLVNTPDVGGLIQEIVNRTDWSAGNALIIIADTIPGTVESKRTSHRRVFAHERDPQAAAVLVVEYE